MASAIAKDRDISSQLSLLRLCSQLEKEGLTVDPKKYPLLRPCVNESTASKNSQQIAPQSQPIQEPQITPPASLKPKTTRVL